MDAIQCLISRRSIREYTDEPISAQEIENVVEIAQMASCWENTQPIRYVAVLDKELKNKIADDCTKKFPWNTENIHAAPALVVLCAIKGLSGFEPDGTPSTTKGTHWQSFDAGIAAQTFCLSAHALGLGTVIMGIYDPAEVAKVVEIPEGQEVAALIALGHPAQDPQAPARKDVDTLLRFE